MSESVIKGYLIAKQDYRDSDEVITFIDENGVKYSCLSLGSRKIESKNGRNLFLGNFCEFEIFMARSEEKVSKLKKAKVIEPADWRLELYQPFNLLCEATNKSSTKRFNLYDFFSNMLKLIKSNEYTEKELILITLHKFCLINGINLHVDSCVECGAKIIRTISFKKKGLVCNAHYDPARDHLFTLEQSQLVHHLFSNHYDQLKNYSGDFDFIIKCLKQYIDDNLGIQFITLVNY